MKEGLATHDEILEGMMFLKKHHRPNQVRVFDGDTECFNLVDITRRLKAVPQPIHREEIMKVIIEKPHFP